MTHDLIKNLLIGLDTQVHKIVVNELRDDTFFAGDLDGARGKSHQY